MAGMCGRCVWQVCVVGVYDRCVCGRYVWQV